MDYRTIVNEENDNAEGPDQSLSPFLQFDTEEDLTNNDKRKREKPILFFFFMIKFIFKESRWSHQKDLDDFFARVYQYHQQHGFFCIILSELFGLV